MDGNGVSDLVGNGGSVRVIPADLREEYDEMRTCALRDSAEHYKNRCIALIERIADLSAENARLKRVPEEDEQADCECGMRLWFHRGFWVDCCHDTRTGPHIHQPLLASRSKEPKGKTE